ncbi:MAG TPA: hypothetical protein VG433_11935 [Pirellulales bacterium]|nr:hypothetical protein [Pirellulales bacterium]
MSHELEQQLARIRRRVRTLLLVYGAAWVAGGVVLGLTVFALADYFIRFEDRGIRMICSLMVLNLTGWVVLRYLWPALRARYSDVQLALRVERRFPQLADRLASTIQFLRQSEDDPLAGSAALRREVIAETTGALEPLDWSDVIDPRPIRRALLVSGAICLSGLALLAAAPQYSAIALARLVNPLGNTAWPQTNHLAFTQSVTRIALGSRFEVELVDVSHAALPREVRMHYRFEGEGEPAAERVEAMKFVGGVMMAGLDDVLRPFEYRAEGGDDNTMPWTRLEVIEPPAIVQLTATLHYPAYTGWPATDSDPHLQALAGTRVALAGKTTKPVRSATISVEHGGRFAARVSDDGFSFTLPAGGAQPLVIRKSGTYTIDMEDREGFHGGQGVRYDVRVIEDRPPTVSLDVPSGDTFVAAGAVVPIQVLVKDDLAIKHAELEITIPGAGAAAPREAKFKLYQGPAQPPPQPGRSAQNPGESRPLTFRLELAKWKLVPGSTLSLRVAASDYQPATAHSQSRRLTVLSVDELQDRLAERRGFILSELGRVLRLERESRAQVSGLEIQLDQVGRLQKQDLDHLQQAELTQRQVERGLAREGEGVPAHIQRLLADLENNKIDNADFQRRMQSLLSELTNLGNEHLPPIARGLTAALKGFSAQQDAAAAAPSAAPGQSLAQAGKHQDSIVQSLEQMLAELAQWDNYRRVHRDVSQLKRDQEELARKTDELGEKTLTRRVDDLEPQQAADLKKLGHRQMELARHFDKLQQRMAEMAEQLRESDPLASDAVDDALHHAREQALAGQMREAGRDVEQNQVGEAAKLQKSAQRGLEELLDILANRRERELDRLVKKLREAEGRLEEMRREQEGLRKQAATAAKNPDEQARRRELERLARRQRQLQEEVERFARQLKRLQAQDASRSAARGGAKMGQAGDRSQQGDGQGAEQQAAAAKKDLDDAQQQLAKARQAAETELAAEQLARLDDQVKSLRGQQEKMLAETRHYDALRTKNGRLSRAEAVTVGQLARQQASAGEETESLAKKLAAARVFELALKGAAHEMADASKLLERRETDEPTQLIQQRALTRLDQLSQSLQAGQPKPGQSGQAGDSGSGGQKSGQQGLPSLAELKLLRLMQQDVYQRTAALDAKRGGIKTLPAGQQRDFDELSREQGQLADLLTDLAKPAKKPADEGDELRRDLKRDSRGGQNGDSLEEIKP